MWSFVSSILRGKVDLEKETNNVSWNNVVSEENTAPDEIFEDCLDGEEDPEVCHWRSYVPQEKVFSSIHPPLSTRATLRVPSHNRDFCRHAESSSWNFAQCTEIVTHPYEISTRESNIRAGDSLNYPADDHSSAHIGSPQDLSEDTWGSTTLAHNREPHVPPREDGSREDGSGSNTSCANGSDSRIHSTPPREEFKSADRKNSESGPWRCEFQRKAVNGQSLSSAVVLNELGSPGTSSRNEVIARTSPWSNVKGGVRASASGAQHPLGEDWISFDELLDDTSQDVNRLTTPHPSVTGASRVLFREERSLNQTWCSSTSDILQLHNSLGAFPLTNSPNCTVDRDSRQLSQLRFPQQRQGVNESSENTAFDPVSSFGNISLDLQSEERRQRQSHGGRSVQWPQLTKHLSVLGSFDFSSKVFPVLTGLKGSSLEETFTVEELEQLEGVREEEVYKYLWYVDGLHSRCTTNEPPKRNVGASTDFRCVVHRTGKVSFQIKEEKNPASTILQRVLGFDRVLKVQFEDGRGGSLSPAQCEVYHRLAENGIFAGLRRYQYFAHKPSDKEEHESEGKVKCYFVCTESRAAADVHNPQFRQFRTIAELRCLFMHIHTTESLSKYNSRLQLVLSKTVSVNLVWSVVSIEDMDDVQCKGTSGQNLPAICTDGTGLISTDIAKMIDMAVFEETRSKRPSPRILEEEYSSIFQVRLFQDGVARKGTLAANRQLPPNTIRCYKSMVKVRRDNQAAYNSLTSLEVVTTSKKTNGRANLSQDLIVLLSICKVPEAFFIKHLTAAMEKSFLIFTDPRAALEELLDWENEKAELLADMISAKISLREPFLHRSLLDMSKSRFQKFAKGKFPLDGTHYLLGTADPTGTLKRNQVTITLSEGAVYCSKVLVYRAPGKHPGDIHVFQATCNERLEADIDTGKYAIYFSTHGPRPITEEIGKGDLDGDRYWVCKNSELISHFQEWHSRWEKESSRTADGTIKPADLTPEELEWNLFELFLQACFNMKSKVGIYSHRWLMHMDEYLHVKDEHSEVKQAHLEAALKLPSVIYDWFDYPKTGIKPRKPEDVLRARRPHHMEKQVKGFGVHADSYHSESILGKIYDQANHKWRLPSYDNFEVDVGFQVANHEKHVQRWQVNFATYRQEMKCALGTKTESSRKSADPGKIILKYRKKLYGGCSSFREAEVLGKKERKLILEEASAIYGIVYAEGQYRVSIGQEPKLSFAWNVAGEALCEIYSRIQPGRSLHLSFCHFKEIFERNKSKHQAPLLPEIHCE